MDLSRWFDQHAREALPPGALVAPADKRQLVGPCASCHQPIATHAYELMAETADADGPENGVDYHWAVLCEACYHRLVEKSFWVKTIEEIAFVVSIGALVVAAWAFIVMRRLSVGLGALGVAVVAPLLRYPLRSLRERMLARAVSRFFPQTESAGFAAMRMPWLEKSILFAVPVPLALVVHGQLPVKDLSSADLKRILMGHVNNWQQLGGPDLPITLYLPVGPWREWSFIHQYLLEKQKPGPHVAMENPLEVFDYLGDDPGGIGFTSLVLLEYFGQGAKPLTIDGQECSAENSAYPLWLMPGLTPVADVPDTLPDNSPASQANRI